MSRREYGGDTVAKKVDKLKRDAGASYIDEAALRTRVKRAMHFLQVFPIDVGIDLSCRNVGVT